MRSCGCAGAGRCHISAPQGWLWERGFKEPKVKSALNGVGFKVAGSASSRERRKVAISTVNWDPFAQRAGPLAFRFRGKLGGGSSANFFTDHVGLV